MSPPFRRAKQVEEPSFGRWPGTGRYVLIKGYGTTFNKDFGY